MSIGPTFVYQASKKTNTIGRMEGRTPAQFPNPPKQHKAHKRRIIRLQSQSSGGTTEGRKARRLGEKDRLRHEAGSNIAKACSEISARQKHSPTDEQWPLPTDQVTSAERHWVVRKVLPRVISLDLGYLRWMGGSRGGGGAFCTGD